MAKPWEKYSQEAGSSKPWERYSEPMRDGMTREEFSAEFRTPSPELQPTLPQRMGQALSERGEEIGRITGGEYQDQGPISDVLQTAGQVAGGALDVTGQVLGQGLSTLTPDVIEHPVREFVGGGVEAGIGAAAESPFVQGAVQGATDLMEEYPVATRNLAALGNLAMAAPAAKPTGQALKSVKGALKKQKPVELQDLVNAEDEAWKIVRDIGEKSGTQIKGQPVRQRINFELKKKANDVNFGKIDPDVHPQATALVSKLTERLDLDSLTPDDLQKTRQLFDTYYTRSLGEMGRNTADTRYVTAIKESFDEVVDSIEPSDLTKGSIEFNKAYKDARKVSAVKNKTAVLDDIYQKAEINARNSSMEVALKNGFRQLANNKKKMKQFTKAEQKLIRNAAKTGAVESLANKFAVFSPTSGRLGAFLQAPVAAGAVGVNPALLALPAIGMGAQSLANRQARRGAQQAFRGVAEQLNPRRSLAERARAVVNRAGTPQSGGLLTTGTAATIMSGEDE